MYKPVVTEEMVEASDAAYIAESCYPIVPANHRNSLRAALEAALSPAFERQEPVAWRKKLSDIEGHFTYSNVNMEGDWEPLFASPVNETERMRESLESIAANTCCDRCQEAALVARAALGRKP